MLKRILKNIFPIVFLKKAYLLVNTVKIRTFDKIVFTEYKLSPGEIILSIEDSPFKDFDVDTLKDEEVKKYMRGWKDWKDQEYIISTQNAIIEPRQGWVVQNGNHLNYFSIGIKSRNNQLPRPSLLAIINRKKTIELENCISLRDPGEENYFHFYNDVIAKLIFLRNKGYNLNKYYIVIASKVWEKSYFKFFIQNSPFLKSLNWHIQKDEFIKAENLILSKPITHRKDIVNEFISWSGVENTKTQKERKVFITRGKNRLRFIENDEEIRQVFNSFGFEVVDADNLDFNQQISLFREARWLVGIHGAGLTNIFYRKGSPMSMLELFPPPEFDYLPYHYVMLSKMYEINYSAMIGEKPKKRFSGGFYINPSLLQKQIEELLIRI